MKLPNGERAKLGQKLERYSLNMDHPNGRHKAILFRKRLGITLDNKEVLEATLIQSAIKGDAILHNRNEYGEHYNLKFFMETEMGSSLVLSCWTIAPDEHFPRLTNCYPVNK